MRAPLLEEASSRPHTPWRPARASLESMQRVQDALGGQTIGFFGSFILIYNQLIGPALLELPKAEWACGQLSLDDEAESD